MPTALCDATIQSNSRDHFSGTLCYADDLTILAQSTDALREMLTIFKNLFRLMRLSLMPVRLNLCVSDTAGSVPAHFLLCGQCLPLVDSVVHFGNILQCDLSDKLDIQSKSMTFICQANSVLFQFNGCDPATKMKLFEAYCFSLYCCPLWRLNAHDLHYLNFYSTT